MNEPLNEHEMQILEEIAGIRPVSPWGAWVGAVLGYLKGGDYITAKFGGKLTPKGIAAIKSVHSDWNAE